MLSIYDIIFTLISSETSRLLHHFKALVWRYIRKNVVLLDHCSSLWTICEQFTVLFHKDIFPVSYELVCMWLFHNPVQDYGPTRSTYQFRWLPESLSCFPFSFHVPCVVSETQHCLKFHTVHLPCRLRFTGNARAIVAWCVAGISRHVRRSSTLVPLTACHNSKVSEFAESRSAFFDRFAQYTNRNVSSASYCQNWSLCSCMRRWHIIYR